MLRNMLTQITTFTEYVLVPAGLEASSLDARTPYIPRVFRRCSWRIRQLSPKLPCNRRSRVLRGRGQLSCTQISRIGGAPPDRERWRGGIEREQERKQHRHHRQLNNFNSKTTPSPTRHRQQLQQRQQQQQQQQQTQQLNQTNVRPTFTCTMQYPATSDAAVCWGWLPQAMSMGTFL